MLERLRARNFRGFRDTGVLGLSKLNLFLGANSSGKSSLLSIPLMLKQTLDDPNPDNCLLTDGPVVDLGSFQEVDFGHDLRSPVTVEVSFDDQLLERTVKGMYTFRRKELSAQVLNDSPKSGLFEFAFAQRRKRIFLSTFETRRRS